MASGHRTPGSYCSMADLIGAEAPDFEIAMVDKTSKRLSEYLAEEKPLVVMCYCNFCPACGHWAVEMEKYFVDERFIGKVNFIILNLRGVEEAETYGLMKRIKECPHGGADCADEFQITSIPHMSLIDENGKFLRNGDFQWQDLDQYIEADEKGNLCDDDDSDEDCAGRYADGGAALVNALARSRIDAARVEEGPVSFNTTSFKSEDTPLSDTVPDVVADDDDDDDDGKMEKSEVVTFENVGVSSAGVADGESGNTETHAVDSSKASEEVSAGSAGNVAFKIASDSQLDGEKQTVEASNDTEESKRVPDAKNAPDS